MSTRVEVAGLHRIVSLRTAKVADGIKRKSKVVAFVVATEWRWANGPQDAYWHKEGISIDTGRY